MKRINGGLLMGLGAASLLPATAIVARAEVYMTPEQAAHLLLPGAKLTPREVALTDLQADAIEKASGQTVRNRKLQAFVAPDRSAVFVDGVLGKHEQITIAVAIGADGAVRGVEVLEYRETYGYQVRNAEWRGQFNGKTKVADLKVGGDIKNISGATLSCAHIAAGVKRLLQTYDVVRAGL